jgi:hypothetical protein
LPCFGPIDNVDIPYANRLGENDREVIQGCALHNNPMVQDVYNTGPRWGFPFASFPVALTPDAATAIESPGQQVACAAAGRQMSSTAAAKFDPP